MWEKHTQHKQFKAEKADFLLTISEVSVYGPLTSDRSIMALGHHIAARKQSDSEKPRVEGTRDWIHYFMTHLTISMSY